MRFVDERADPQTRISIELLQRFAVEIFVRAGLKAEDAELASDALLIADIRGIESHGIARLPIFCHRLRDGLTNLHPQVTVVRESASTLVLDLDNGFGYSEAPKAMMRCIEKAESTGICFATVRNSNHFGIAGHYVLMATAHDLGAIAMTNASSIVLPAFGTQPMLGTNPIAIGVPTGSQWPLIVDMATSTVAYGKLEVAQRAGVPLPPGWATDETGRPTTDSAIARHLLPLGWSPESGGHKGYALAVMVDAMCGPLSGGGWSAAIAGTIGSDKQAGICHAFIAWRIDAFQEPAEFKKNINRMIDDLRAATPAAGHEVMAPGDPERLAEIENRARGVPVRSSVQRSLAALAGEFRVEHPFATE